MTRHYALEAIRAQPWAILPAHLGAIEAIADRALQAPVLDVLRADGHAERYRVCLSAVADTGKRMDGTNSVMLNRQGVATIPVMGPIFPRANMMTEFSGATSLSSLMADLQAANASSDVSQILMVFVRQIVPRRFNGITAQRAFKPLAGGRDARGGPVPYILKGAGIASGLSWTRKGGWARKHTPYVSERADRQAGEQVLYPTLILTERIT